MKNWQKDIYHTYRTKDITKKLKQQTVEQFRFHEDSRMGGRGRMSGAWSMVWIRHLQLSRAFNARIIVTPVLRNFCTV